MKKTTAAAEQLLAVRRELDEVAQHVDQLAAALSNPEKVRLVGQAEAAEMLGWKVQKVTDERRVGRFPEPYQQLRMGPVWLAAQIEAMRDAA